MVKDTFGFVYRIIITLIVILGISVISLSFVMGVESHRTHAVSFYIVDDTVEPVRKTLLTSSLVMANGSVGLPNVTDNNRPEGVATSFVFDGWFIDLYFVNEFNPNNVKNIRQVFGRFIDPAMA